MSKEQTSTTYADALQRIYQHLSPGLQAHVDKKPIQDGLPPVVIQLLARGQEAGNILANLCARTATSRVTAEGISSGGLGVDLTADVLLAMLAHPDAKNLVHFTITKGGEMKAVVTIQKPTGKTPTECLREMTERYEALRTVAIEVCDDFEDIGQDALDSDTVKRLRDAAGDVRTDTSTRKGE